MAIVDDLSVSAFKAFTPSELGLKKHRVFDGSEGIAAPLAAHKPSHVALEKHRYVPTVFVGATEVYWPSSLTRFSRVHKPLCDSPSGLPRPGVGQFVTVPA